MTQMDAFITWAKREDGHPDTGWVITRRNALALVARLEKAEGDLQKILEEPCEFSMVSSRVCERGSRSCIVEHVAVVPTNEGGS